jgi:hypothetical protein
VRIGTPGQAAREHSQGARAGCVVEAGVVEAGVIEAGVIEAGVVEVGVVDVGVGEAGVVDLSAGASGSPATTASRTCRRAG